MTTPSPTADAGAPFAVQRASNGRLMDSILSALGDMALAAQAVHSLHALREEWRQDVGSVRARTAWQTARRLPGEPLVPLEGTHRPRSASLTAECTSPTQEASTRCSSHVPSPALSAIAVSQSSADATPAMDLSAERTARTPSLQAFSALRTQSPDMSQVRARVEARVAQATAAQRRTQSVDGSPVRTGVGSTLRPVRRPINISAALARAHVLSTGAL